MKKRFFSFLIKVVLVGFLLTGLLLVWSSLQSYESLASLLNHLASDGELESFTVFLYHLLRMPFVLGGIVMAALSGFLLLQLRKTEVWIRRFPARAKRFFALLREDAVIYWKDLKASIANQGWLINSFLAGVIFVALVLRLKNLNLPLGHDEAYMYNAFASRSFWHIVTNYHLPNNHVFLSIVMKIVTGLFGNHVWTLRLPTIIAGVLMIPASYYFAKRFYSIETGILSSILIAVFPILVQYSVLARGYEIIALMTLITFTLSDYVRVNKNRFVWTMIVILSAMGFFTIPIMLFPWGALYIWLIVSCLFKDTRSYASKFDFLKYWFSSGIITAVITVLLYTPIMIYSYQRFFGNGFIAPLEWDIFTITIWTRLRNTWIEWTEFVPLWISILGAVGFFVSLIFHKRFSKQKFPPQLAFLTWIVTILIARRPDMLPRFWLYLTAPILIWSAAGIIEPLRRISLKIGKGWNLAQVFVTLIFAFVFVQSFFTISSLPASWTEKDDMEKIAIYLKDYFHEDDLVTASTARSPAMRYYFNYYDFPRGTIRESGKFQRAFIIVDTEKGETLRSNSPKLGFDIPAIDMETAKVLVQFDYLTVYECYPSQ
ncbi:MAG: glycosyltransferase family 39 protein [Anaerolineales bacterium]